MRYAKEYPNAAVKVQWTPGDYTSKLDSGLLSSTGPDVFESSSTSTRCKSEQVVPLDDIIADVKDDFTEADIKSQPVDGKIYGIRMIDDMGVLYYRKSVLDKAGVQPPTTIDELIAASKARPRRIEGPVHRQRRRRNAFIRRRSVARPDPVVRPAGLPDRRQQARLHRPEAKRGFRQDARACSTASRCCSARPPTGGTRRRSPRAWRRCSGAACGRCPASRRRCGDDFGVVACPAFSSTVGKPSTFLGGWAAQVSAKAKNVDAAKAFVKWLWIDNSEDQEDFNLSYGFHIPPRKSLAAKADKLQRARPPRR